MDIFKNNFERVTKEQVSSCRFKKKKNRTHTNADINIFINF